MEILLAKIYDIYESDDYDTAYFFLERFYEHSQVKDEPHWIPRADINACLIRWARETFEDILAIDHPGYEDNLLRLCSAVLIPDNKNKILLALDQLTTIEEPDSESDDE